jgi:IS30 family transposase
MMKFTHLATLKIDGLGKNCQSPLRSNSLFGRTNRLEIYFAQLAVLCQAGGTKENTNGLIRHYFPKGMKLAAVPKRKFARVQNLLNNCPRKHLGNKTP